MLLKESKGGLNKWKDLSCSWMERLNIVKMLILVQLIYKFNAIPINSSKVFVDIDKGILKFT